LDRSARKTAFFTHQCDPTPIEKWFFVEAVEDKAIVDPTLEPVAGHLESHPDGLVELPGKIGLFEHIFSI
jgi:hypothetical protein